MLRRCLYVEAIQGWFDFQPESVLICTLIQQFFWTYSSKGLPHLLSLTSVLAWFVSCGESVATSTIWVLNSLLSLVFLKIILYWQLQWSRMAGEQWEVLLPITGSDCTLGSLISLLKSVINIGPLFFVPKIFCQQLNQNWWPVTSCQHCTKWMCCVKCHSFEKDSKKA